MKGKITILIIIFLLISSINIFAEKNHSDNGDGTSTNPVIAYDFSDADVIHVGDNPYGPFTYKGIIMTPVVGWTTHHCIVEFKSKWYLFHHDSVPSGGKTWLRSLKVVELEYNEDGSIKTIDGGGQG